MLVRICRIKPAPGQLFARQKDKIGFRKLLRLLELFTCMQATLNASCKWIKQGCKMHHLNERSILLGCQKHGSRFIPLNLV